MRQQKVIVYGTERTTAVTFYIPNASKSNYLREKWTMKLKVDGAGVGSHVNRASVEGLGLGTMAPEAADTALSEEIRWTQIAENRSAESRHDRIARAAYYPSEARGFEPGHDAEDWLLAQSAIDALDASISLRP